LERKKILLTDGAELIRRLEKALFRRKSFRLLVARSGQQALEIIEKEAPDLVFLDLEMAGMSGDVCCRKVKSDPRLCSTPVVIVVPFGNEEDLARCHQAGCDEIVVKPINRHQLSPLTRRFLAVVGRKISRHEACLRISYGTDPQRFHTGHTLNLGTGGVLIKTSYLLPVNTQIFLEIVLPGACSTIRCRGRVAWLKDPIESSWLPEEMGIQFLDLAPEDKDAIRAYVEGEGLRS